MIESVKTQIKQKKVQKYIIAVAFCNPRILGGKYERLRSEENYATLQVPPRFFVDSGLPVLGGENFVRLSC